MIKTTPQRIIFCLKKKLLEDKLIDNERFRPNSRKMQFCEYCKRYGHLSRSCSKLRASEKLHYNEYSKSKMFDSIRDNPASFPKPIINLIMYITNPIMDIPAINNGLINEVLVHIHRII